MGVKKLVSLLVKYPTNFENSLILGEKWKTKKRMEFFFKTRVMMML